MISTCLTVLLAWQAPAPDNAPPKDPKPIKSQPAVPALADREAKSIARDFNKAMKGKPSMADKKRALEMLAQGTNKAFVKPLTGVIEDDKMVLIRRRAAELLALQPERYAKPAIDKLLKSPRIQEAPPVTTALVTGFTRFAPDKGDWETLEVLFEISYAPEQVPVHEAVLDYVKQHKIKAACDLLLRNLDEPAPKDIHDPANPPAEYWEARWKAWKAWRARLQEALFAVTGQRFSTEEEARNWLKKNPLK
jgi:hypothetical protein